MKALINRVLSIVICTIAFAFAANAQQYTTQLEEKVLPVGEFTSVSVSNDFEVTLAKGAYNTKVTVDKVLSPYVQVYVRSKTLYITYDEKSVPKDIRKMFKGRNAPQPHFRATVYMPQIGGIILSDNATLLASDEFAGDQVEINLADKSQLKGLTLIASSILINTKKNTQASVNFKADNKIEIITDGNANLTAMTECDELVVSAAGNSNVSVNGFCSSTTLSGSGSPQMSISQKAQKASLQLGGSTELILTGEAETLYLKSEKSAKLNANGFDAKTIEADMSGSSKAEVNVSELLDATLVGGSALYYTGTPVFKIGKVFKSTLAPLGATGK